VNLVNARLIASKYRHMTNVNRDTYIIIKLIREFTKIKICQSQNTKNLSLFRVVLVIIKRIGTKFKKIDVENCAVVILGLKC
jgi:hypothetical protein